MTGCAITREQAFSKLPRIRILRQYVEVHFGEARINRFVAICSCLHFLFVLALLRPAHHALECTDAWVHNHVTDSPNNRSEVQIQPPLWGGVIPLLEVAIPTMPDEIFVLGILRSLLAGPIDEVGAPENEGDCASCNEPGPECRHQIFSCSLSVMG